MAKRRQEEPREVTRKETVRRRKDAETNRRYVMGLIGVGVLLVLLVGAGIVQELLIKPNQPIATVNNDRISTKDYQKLVKYAWFQQQGQVTDPQGTSQKVLDQAVDDTLLAEQAKQRNITVTDDEVTQQIEKLFGYYRVPPTPIPTATPDPSATPSKEPTATPAPTSTPISLETYQTAYKNYLGQLNRATGMTEADFRVMIKRDVIRQKLFDEVTKDVPTTGEQVKLRHILVAIRTPAPTATPYPTGQPTPTITPSPTIPAGSTPAPTATPTPGPRDDAQALARAKEAQQKLASGQDFATVAKEYSDDPGSAAQGGELGWFARGMGLDTDFETAAFKLQAGQTSDPVKTQFGYHLIQVEERDPNRKLDPYLLQQNQSDAYQKWLTDLRNAAKVNRNWSLDKVPPTPGLQSQGG